MTAGLAEITQNLTALGGGNLSVWGEDVSYYVLVEDGGEWIGDPDAEYELRSADFAVCEAVRDVLSLPAWPQALTLRTEDGEVEISVGTASEQYEFRNADGARTMFQFAYDPVAQTYWCLNLRDAETDARKLKVYAVDHDGSSITEPNCGTLGELLAAWRDGTHPR